MKNIIKKCLNDNNQLFVDHEAIYWNQVYKIKNYGNLIAAFDVLYDQKRNNIDPSGINNIVTEFGSDVEVAQISIVQFNQFTSYISALNAKIPLYYSILETMVQDQDEKVINIKLPDSKIQSLNDLTEFNKRLSKILDMFNLDGQFDFVWVDKWSRWYEVLAVGTMSFNAFIWSLNIAQEVFHTRQAYYESQEAKIEYKAALSSLDTSQKYSEEWLNKYIEAKIDKEIEFKIEQMLNDIQIEGTKTEPEIINKTIMATKELIKELWEWTEFHLSLNPPSYAEEIWWSLEINYKKLSALIQEENAPKKLENKNEVKEDEVEQEIKSE